MPAPNVFQKVLRPQPYFLQCLKRSLAIFSIYFRSNVLHVDFALVFLVDRSPALLHSISTAITRGAMHEGSVCKFSLRQWTPCLFCRTAFSKGVCRLRQFKSRLVLLRAPVILIEKTIYSLF